MMNGTEFRNEMVPRAFRVPSTVPAASTFLVGYTPRNALCALHAEGVYFMLDRRSERWAKPGMVARGHVVDMGGRPVDAPRVGDTKQWVLLDRFEVDEVSAHAYGMLMERWLRARGDLLAWGVPALNARSNAAMNEMDALFQQEAQARAAHDAALRNEHARALEGATEAFLCVRPKLVARRGKFHHAVNAGAVPGKVYAGIRVGSNVVLDTMEPLRVSEGRVHEWLMLERGSA